MDFSNVLSIPAPSFNLSPVQINHIKRLWISLEIISINAPPGPVVPPPPNPTIPVVNRRPSFQVLTNYAGATTIVLVPAPKAPPPTPPLPQKTPAIKSAQTLPTLRYNLTNLRNFQSKLCTKIFQLEHEPPVTSPSSRLKLFDLFKLAPLQFHAIEANYQVIQMLQLISIVINCVEFNKELPVTYIKHLANINSRLYSMDRRKYLIFGEALILSIIEYLAERSLVESGAKKQVSFEEQLAFNEFSSQLLTQLVEHSNDPKLLIPMMHTPSNNNNNNNNIRNETNIAKSYTYEDSVQREVSTANSSVGQNVRSSYSEISVKSSRLSLCSPSELDYDVNSLDEIAIIKTKTAAAEDSDSDKNNNNNKSGTTVNGLQKEWRLGEEPEHEFSESDENEDEVYAMINAFGTELPKLKKKKSKLSFFRRSVSGPKQATTSGRENRLKRVASNISFVH